MENKKLEKWVELLLDTGKRNNLINFHDTKASSAEVLLPEADVLFTRVGSHEVFEVFDPKIAEQDDLFVPESEKKDEDITSGKQEFLDKYAPGIKKQTQLLMYNGNGTNPVTAVKNIDKKSREYIEETGVNVVYLAFGFIHWKESEHSNIVFRAPVLLMPVRIQRDSLFDSFKLRIDSEEMILNPTFTYYLNQSFGLKLPEYEDEGLSAYLDRIGEIVGKMKWMVSSECKLGIFSFQKINMYRDLKDNEKKLLENPNVQTLLGEIPVNNDSAAGLQNDYFQNMRVVNPILDLHNVVDADSSQMEAIEMVKSGKSFVLQGPPGTGKSQTITNIIAEVLGDGKKVLFVSEKLAALQVVYDKLRKVGLEEFCLELHSHKANKKAFIDELCRTLRASKTSVSEKANTELAILEKAQQTLDAYAEELHKPRPVIGMSLYQLYEKYAAFRLNDNSDFFIPNIEKKSSNFLTETVGLLEQYAQYSMSIGSDYHLNPWYGYQNPDVSYYAKKTVQENLTIASEQIKRLLPILSDLSSSFGIVCGNPEEVPVWHDFFLLLSSTLFITPGLLDGSRFSRDADVLEKLKAMSSQVITSKNAIDAVYTSSVYELDGEQLNARLKKEFSGVFSRLFSKEYKRVINSLYAAQKDGKKPSYSEALAVTERLAFFQQQSSEYVSLESQIQGDLDIAYTGVASDWEYITDQTEKLQRIMDLVGGTEALSKLSMSEFENAKTKFLTIAKEIETVLPSGLNAFHCVRSYFDPKIFDFKKVSVIAALDKLNACKMNIDGLDNWCRFRVLLDKLTQNEVLAFVDQAIDRGIAPARLTEVFKKQFYYQWIDYIQFSSPILSGFNRITQDQTVDLFIEKDKQNFEINKAVIRSVLSAKRPSLDLVAGGSAVAILRREGEKKRNQKNIRTLMTEISELVQVIKPCFLMSPLSVSTFLNPEAVHFDVVIFDEASQIFPQDAIGAIYRASQLIVVGDSKQMPPSNFFNSSVSSEGQDDEEDGDVRDFESILDLCSTSMRQLCLRWHYRSKYEQLITFSNKNFYDGELVTFPSAKATAPGAGVDYYYVPGLFDHKSHTNVKEAEAIIDLVYEHIEKYPDRSLGIVAFSMAQQDLIDKLLSRRRQNTPEKEFFFASDVKEPFFIKNLETVQGDERDTIIFSVAYGYDVQGKLLHNFGPLNRVGGERRLNVAVTRAKCNVQLVASIHYTDIDLKRTSSEGARLLREYLDYAENGTIALQRTLSVSKFEEYDSDFEMEVCEFLRSEGFAADTQIGCSGFRIDIGVKRPDSSDYVLAVECDGASYHSSKNARDRDRLRQENLERMGWKFYRIWSTDWFKNKASEQQRLLAAARNAIDGISPSSASSTPAAEEFVFEELKDEHIEFPKYEEVDIRKLSQKYNENQFKDMVKAVLQVEAPLSEEYLQKRVAFLFGREKVTAVVQREYEVRMLLCKKYGIIQKNGFLYLEGMNEIHFRAPGQTIREVKYIAPEELADGMYEILKQNISANKNGLYHSLAILCGVTRSGKVITDCFDAALALLVSEGKVISEGDMFSVRDM